MCSAHGPQLISKKCLEEEIFTGTNFRELAFDRENRENFPLYGISSRRGIPNWAVWLRFHNFPLLYAGRESYAEASTTRQREFKLLTTAATVDNVAEKVVECPLNWGH